MYPRPFGRGAYIGNGVKVNYLLLTVFNGLNGLVKALALGAGLATFLTKGGFSVFLM